jgi:hypothetical protein
MVQKTIKFTGTGDFSQLIRSSKEVTGILQNNLGKSGIQIFDKGSINFLTQYSKNIFGQMTIQMQKLVEEAKELDSVLQDGALSEQRQNAAVEARLANLKKMSTLQREMKEVGGNAGLANGPGFGRQATGLATRGAAGVANAAGLGAPVSIAAEGFHAASNAAEGGVGAMGALGLGALATAAAGAVFAVNQMTAAFEEFSREVPNMLTGAAIGIGTEPSQRERNSSLEMGFNVQQTMSQRLDLARAFGTQRSSREQENILINTQRSGRALGVDPNEIAGAGNQLRSVVGPQESLRTVSQILSRALMDGMDKSQATHFLSTSVSLLTELNKSGLQSTASFAAAMGALTKGNMMSPEMAARGLRGIQGAITGAQGESAQFFRFGAARGGIGGTSLLGAVAAQEQGLTGINREQFLKTTGNNKQALGMLNSMGLVDNGDYTKRYAQGILEQINATGFKENTAGRARFVQGQFGLGTMQESFQVENILKKLASGTNLTKEEKSKMQELGKDPESVARDKATTALNNLAGEIAKVEAKQSFTKFDLGKDSTDAMLALKDALIELDQTIISIFGVVKDVKGAVSASMNNGVLGAVSDMFSGNGSGAGAAAYGTLGSDTSGSSKGTKPETTMEKLFTTMLSIIGLNADQTRKTNELLETGNKDRKQGMSQKVPAQPPMVERKK